MVGVSGIISRMIPKGFSVVIYLNKSKRKVWVSVEVVGISRDVVGVVGIVSRTIPEDILLVKHLDKSNEIWHLSVVGSHR